MLYHMAIVHARAYAEVISLIIWIYGQRLDFTGQCNVHCYMKIWRREEIYLKEQVHCFSAHWRQERRSVRADFVVRCILHVVCRKLTGKCPEQVHNRDRLIHGVR